MEPAFRLHVLAQRARMAAKYVNLASSTRYSGKSHFAPRLDGVVKTFDGLGTMAHVPSMRTDLCVTLTCSRELCQKEDNSPAVTHRVFG